MSRPRRDRPTRALSLRLDIALLERLEAEAEVRVVSVRWMVEKLLAEGLERLIPVEEFSLTRRKVRENADGVTYEEDGSQAPVLSTTETPPDPGAGAGPSPLGDEDHPSPGPSGDADFFEAITNADGWRGVVLIPGDPGYVEPRERYCAFHGFTHEYTNGQWGAPCHVSGEPRPVPAGATDDWEGFHDYGGPVPT